jgi:uncharacterized membrane protein (DUF485 family)
MSTELVRRVTGDPVYAELNRRRSKLAWLLTTIMMLVYYGFILLIAFSPATLKQRVGAGATTLGLPLGVIVILVAIALTGIYVHKANTEFDRLNEQLKKHAQS